MRKPTAHRSNSNSRTSFFCLAACALAVAAAPAADWAAALKGHGLAYAGKTAWRATLDKSWGEGGSRRTAAEAGDVRLRVASEPARDAESAARLLGEWKARLDGQFEGSMSYPGMVTRRFEVPEALRPRAVPASGGGRSLWLVPATERLTFGAGADDLVRFMAVVSHRWCPKAGRAVELAVFYPRASFDEKTALAAEAGFSCPGSSVPARGQ